MNGSNYLNIDHEDRNDKLFEFGNLLAAKTKDRVYQKSQESFISKNPESLLVDHGFILWKTALENVFPVRPPLSQDWLRYKNSSIWKNGFSLFNTKLGIESIHKMNKLLIEGQKVLKEKSNGKELDVSYSVDRLFSTQRDYVIKEIMNLVGLWESFYLPEGLTLIPWRFHAFTTLPCSRKSLSERWHYDTNTTDDIIFFMINLTDCDKKDNAGTFFIDATNSAKISLFNDYISTPVDYRAPDSEVFGLPNDSKSISFIPASCGNLVAFHPGRTLHKGSRGSLGRRDNLHVSAIIVPKCLKIKGMLGDVYLDGSAEELRDFCWSESSSEQANLTNGAPYYVENPAPKDYRD